MTTITPDVIDAFLKCKTKAYLLAKTLDAVDNASGITQLANVRSPTDELQALLSAADPPAFIPCNHCSDCQFTDHCRNRAISRDDIALLGGLKPKQIVKLRQRGIHTITQLSHTFRLRRKSKRTNVWKKYQPSLKALAVREKKTYIIGPPRVNVKGTPVSFDAEGVPDQAFYYLIGMRIGEEGSITQHSFWANRHVDEELIWQDCIRALREVRDPQPLHYGSYETLFLRRMKRRYGNPCTDQFIDKLLAEAVNVVSVIRGNVYFPTYSNGLKEIGSHLGYEWSTFIPTGFRTIAVRRDWETRQDIRLKQALIAYNQDDCKALEAVVCHLSDLSKDWENGESSARAIRVDSLKPEWSGNWGTTEFVSPELSFINMRAYWNYQRDKIYFRSRARVNPKTAQPRRAKPTLPINKIITTARPQLCWQCRSRRIRWNGRHTKLSYDIKWIKGGMKRWVTQTTITHHRCIDCGATCSSKPSQGMTRERYGRELLNYAIYHLIQLHVSQYKLAGILQRLFSYPLSQQTITRMKNKAAKFYKETFEQIKRSLVRGHLIHADETRIGLKGRASYVWVFASMEAVVYIWSPTRGAKHPMSFCVTSRVSWSRISSHLTVRYHAFNRNV
jgi:RNase_H superfamily/Transposase IS66 family